MGNCVTILKKTAVLAAIAALATGCASVQKIALDPASSAALQGKTLVQTKRLAKPDFTAFTAGKAALGMLGAMAMISAGNDIVKLNSIDDPADALSAALAQKLQTMRGMQVVTPAAVVTGAEPEALVAAAKGAGKYVLDVQTTGWMFSYYPTDWTHYRVMYVAQARLIDADSKKVLAHGVCQHMPENKVNPPTYDQLVLNGATGLKKELATAVEACSKSLAAEMLAL